MPKTLVIPCSGMGKVYGLVARESALSAVKNICPDQAETACLANIVMGDEEARSLVEGKECITVDGCAAMCAAKSVELAGGVMKKKIRVINTFRQHKGAKPGNATELTEEGWAISDEIAGDIAKIIMKGEA